MKKLISSSQLSKRYYLEDIGSKVPSSGKNFAALDGARGLAAILVLGDHVGCPGLDGAGPVGVVIFFCLSGYLLSMSFARSPAKASDFGYLKNYLRRRLFRIVPMFYFICITSYLFTGELGDFIRTLLFVQAEGILWTVLQEIYFYLLLPIIILLNFYLFRGRLVLCVLFLLAVTIAFNNGYIPTFRIYGHGVKMPLFLGLFLSGMLMCYVFHLSFIKESRLIKRIADNSLIGLVCLLLLVSTQHLYRLFPTIPSDPGWLYRSNFCLFFSTILLFITLSKDSVLSRVLSTYPLRAVGIVGYSFYLLHPILLTFTKIISQQYLGIHLSGLAKFAIVIVLTYLTSAITYTYVERPFLKQGEN